MDNQHKLVKGYRDLTQNEIDAMNEIKAFEAKWNGLVDRLKNVPDIDMRNIALAVTYCEDGFSRAVRAVARPDRVVDHDHNDVKIQIAIDGGTLNVMSMRSINREWSPEKNHQVTVVATDESLWLLIRNGFKYLDIIREDSERIETYRYFDVLSQSVDDNNGEFTYNFEFKSVCMVDHV